jgi:hypothetical protein
LATPKFITGLCKGPDDVVLAGVDIVLELSQACTIPGTQEVLPKRVRTTSAADGTWTVSVYANNDLTPNGTYYRKREMGTDGSYSPATLQVPQGVDSGNHAGTSGDPFRATLLEVAVPPASPVGALDSAVVHKALDEAITGDKYFQSGVPWHDLRADAKCDTWLVPTGTCTVGSPIYQAPSPIFTAAEVGKIFDLYTLPLLGVGITGTQMGTIVGFIDSTHVTLSVNANHNAAGNATLVYGTDDTAAVQTWLNRTGGYHAFSGATSIVNGADIAAHGTGIAMVTGTVSTPAGISIGARKFVGGAGLFWASARLGSNHVVNLDTLQGGLLRDLHFNASMGFLGRFITAAWPAGDTGPTMRLEGCTTFSPNDDADWHVFIHGNVVHLDHCEFNTNNKIYNKCLWVSASISGCSAVQCAIIGRCYSNCQQMNYESCSPMGPLRVANNSLNDGSGTAQQVNVVNLDGNYSYSTSRGGVDYPNIESVVANANGTDVAGGGLPIINLKGGYVVFGSGAGAIQSAISGNFTASQGSTGLNIDGTGFVQSSTSPATTVYLVTATGGAGAVYMKVPAANILASVTTAILFRRTAGSSECVVTDYVPSGQAVKWQHPTVGNFWLGGATNLPASGTWAQNALATAIDIVITGTVTKVEISPDQGTTVYVLWQGTGSAVVPMSLRWPAGAWMRFTWTVQPTYMGVPVL